MYTQKNPDLRMNAVKGKVTNLFYQNSVKWRCSSFSFTDVKLFYKVRSYDIASNLCTAYRLFESQFNLLVYRLLTHPPIANLNPCNNSDLKN